MKWNVMKFGFAERAISCGLLSAVTLAVASGMQRPDVPLEAIAEVDFEFVAQRADGAGASSEQRLAKLVEAVEKATDADKEAKKIALKQALSEIFRTKTQAQQKRIAEMKERLQTVESQLGRRMELEEQIVQRRLRELLGEKDELSWESESAVDIGLLDRDAFGKDRVGKPRLVPGSGPESRAEEYSSMAEEFREAALDFPKEYPSEFPIEFSFEVPAPAMAAARDRNLQRAKRVVEQAEEAAADAKRAGERGVEARYREARLREAKTLEDALNASDHPKALESLRASLLEKDQLLKETFGKEGVSRAQLEVEFRALQAQTTALQKRLEEVTRQAEENSRKK